MHAVQPLYTGQSLTPLVTLLALVLGTKVTLRVKPFEFVIIRKPRKRWRRAGRRRSER
jgi:hypothetical protein